MRKYLVLIFFSFVLVLGGCKGKRTGAICNDGTRSYATGSGACSHHHGVDYWVHEND